MTDKFRRDGTPYPDGDEGLFEWGKDMGDPKKKIVRQEVVGDYFISTVWLGLNHQFGEGRLLIFETMVFKTHTKDNLGDEVEMDRYSTEEEALEGHKKMVEKWKKN